VSDKRQKSLDFSWKRREGKVGLHRREIPRDGEARREGGCCRKRTRRKVRK